MQAQPESNAAPTKSSRNRFRVLTESLSWLRTGVTVVCALLSGENAASSAIETTRELAARALAAITGLDN